MTFSILIVNWNSKDYLRKCLKSIGETCAHLSPQIVVVDGGSFDGCDRMLATEFPECEFVQSPDNIGFGRSNNLGFEKCTGEVLMLLNPDTELMPGAVDSLLEELERMPRAGLLGARLLNTDGSLQYAAVHPLPTPWNAATDSDWLRRRWWNKNNRRNTERPFEVEAVSGACMMMKSATYRSLGGFDPGFFMYAEDMDLCHGIRKLGLAIYHVPGAGIIHHGGASSGTQFSKFSEVMIREALSHYFTKNHGPDHAALYRMLIFISAVARIAILSVSGIPGKLHAKGRRNPSIRKWFTLLRWSLGHEAWAARSFHTGVAPEIGHAARPAQIQPCPSGQMKACSEKVADKVTSSGYTSQ